MTYVFEHISGIYVLDDSLKVIEEKWFSKKDSDESRAKVRDVMHAKYSDVTENDAVITERMLKMISERCDVSVLRELNMKQTREKIKESVTFDSFVLQTIMSLRDLDVVINRMVGVLREWFGLYDPETERGVEDHRKFVSLILSDKYTGPSKMTMGGTFRKVDVDQMLLLAKRIAELFSLEAKQETYVCDLMEKHCPNVSVVATPMIGAKLLALAGSLKRLSELPASTVQILGAEKALFRHMKTGAKMPKHGIILHHPLVSKVGYELHGKAARAVADKISIAAKVDFFKGNFVGEELKKGLCKKFDVSY